MSGELDHGCAAVVTLVASSCCTSFVGSWNEKPGRRERSPVRRRSRPPVGIRAQIALVAVLNSRVDAARRAVVTAATHDDGDQADEQAVLDHAAPSSSVLRAAIAFWTLVKSFVILNVLLV